MAEKKQSTAGTATATHQAFFDFLNAVLRFLRSPEATEKRHDKDLEDVENLAAKLKVGVPGCCEDAFPEAVSQHVDRVVVLLREYYPSEGDSSELEEAIDNLTDAMRQHCDLS